MRYRFDNVLSRGGTSGMVMLLVTFAMAFLVVVRLFIVAGERHRGTTGRARCCVDPVGKRR